MIGGSIIQTGILSPLPVIQIGSVKPPSSAQVW